MKPIKVRFLRFDGPGVIKPVFKDGDGNEYHWPSGSDATIKGAHKGFWDEIGCNEKLIYKITFRKKGSKNIVTEVLGYK